MSRAVVPVYDGNISFPVSRTLQRIGRDLYKVGMRRIAYQRPAEVESHEAELLPRQGEALAISLLDPEVGRHFIHADDGHCLVSFKRAGMHHGGLF